METQKIIARDDLYDDILSKLLSNFKSGATSLYVCGKPGTGKTFTIDRVLSEIKRRKALFRKFHQIIEINGMEITSSADIWKILHRKLDIAYSKASSLPILHYCSELIKPIILLIDEFENLITKCNKNLISEIFSLPFSCQKIKLLSVSNLVDLPDIFMPNLEKRNCVPEIIVFPPYNKSEILQIIKDLYGDCSDSIALEVCAAQSESIGDLRRALGICKNSLKNGRISLNSTMKSTTNWNSVVKVLTDLPYLNKGALVICKKLSENKMTTTQMHSAYKRICIKEGGEGLPLKEFVDMMQNLAAVGVVKFVGNASNVLKKYPEVVVTLNELEKGFKDLPEILNLINVDSGSSWKFSI